jgi:hypothetical protein
MSIFIAALLALKAGMETVLLDTVEMKFECAMVEMLVAASKRFRTVSFCRHRRVRYKHEKSL